jgi:nicotinate-nucleotide adenylyltransferase
MRRIGLLGGSFDPIHNGHINIADAAYREFNLDEVWFIPSGHSPNKNESRMSDVSHRFKMVELAIEAVPYFKISDIELGQQGTTYTYLTLAHLHDKYPEFTFYFIMGADSLDYFEQWKYPQRICDLANILIAVRDELGRQEVDDKIERLKRDFKGNFYQIAGGETDISSTDIRHKIRLGTDISTIVPPKVCDYINKEHLYRL